MPRPIRLVAVVTAVAVFTIVAWSGSQPADDPAIPADPGWQWFKGNLHTHSLWSDGNDYPEMIAEWYRTQGYHFLALSDHNILSEGTKWVDAELSTKRGGIAALERYRQRFGDAWVETREVEGRTEVRLKPLGEFRSLVEESGKFIMIQSEEITDKFDKLPIHVNAANLRDLIKPQGGSSVRETMKNNLLAVERQSERTGQPMLAHLNHPNFNYAVTAEDMAAVLEEQFFEVYNGHPGVHHEGDHHHAPVERLWDIANTIRLAEMQAPPLFGLATDDSHNYFGQRNASPGRGWVMVRARHLTPEALIAAIKQGDFYASSGVELASVDYSRERGTLELIIVPQDDAKFTTQFIGTLQGVSTDSSPVLDDKGQPLPVTRKYSAEVGKVLATAQGLRPKYQLTGKELYVRAVVTSSQAPVNPAFEHQHQQAWTQPVGWQKWLDK